MTTYQKGSNALYILKKIVQTILGLIAGTLFWLGLFSIPSWSEIVGK